MRRTCVMTLVALSCLALRATATADEPRRPNVLFIVADDQRWDTVAALGNPEIRTPHLDALVKRGFVFHNAYCMGSMIPAVCAPSRTMLMTGRSLWRIPAPATKQWDGPSLGGLFRDAGYATFFVGKRGNSFVAGNQAFETFVYHEGKKRPRERESQFMADETLGWLAARNEKGDRRPFLAYLGPPVPHDPRVAPAKFHQQYDPAKLTLSKNFLAEHPFDNGELRIRDEELAAHPRTEAEMRQHLADYYATIANFDEQVGRVLDGLRQQGELERTLVVYTSDQGLAVGGRHGLMGKQNLYEHVKPPLVIAGPGVPTGQSDALVYLFDLLPTACDYAGIQTPEVCEGKSLLPIIRGEKEKVRETLFAAYRDCQRMVRDGRWKLIEYHGDDGYHTQLFDLQHDPDEIHNLADDPRHASQLARLRTELAAAKQAFGDPVDWSKPRGK